MKNTMKVAALGALLAVSGGAYADQATTTGGLKIKTDDGRFEFGLGGRIHYDAYIFSNDDDARFGSATDNVAGGLGSQGGFAFRRTYLTLTGKAYGWKYKFENDFAAGASPGSYREMWIAAPLANDQELIIGQFKPRRGLEEVTSSNEITMMERPNTTATGIYSGRQFLMGAGYKGTFSDQLMIEVDYRGLGPAGTTTEGNEYGTRLAWFPMADDGHAMHLGLSYSYDQEQCGVTTPATAGCPATGTAAASTQATAVAQYAGRRGPSLNFGNVGAANTTQADSAQETIALEAGMAFGPVLLQTEYAMATLENTHLENGAPTDSDVTAGYFQASWFVTGEKVIYKKDRAAFGKPKLPLNSFGAIELTARYEIMKNDTESATNQICTVAGGGVAAATAVAASDKCEATTLTIGTNWYVNPNVRLMLNAYKGTADLGGTNGKDSPTAVSLRTQFSF